MRLDSSYWLQLTTEMKLPNDSLNMFIECLMYLQHINSKVGKQFCWLSHQITVFSGLTNEFVTELMHFKSYYLNCSQLLTGVQYTVVYSALPFEKEI